MQKNIFGGNWIISELNANVARCVSFCTAWPFFWLHTDSRSRRPSCVFETWSYLASVCRHRTGPTIAVRLSTNAFSDQPDCNSIRHWPVEPPRSVGYPSFLWPAHGAIPTRTEHCTMRRRRCRLEAILSPWLETQARYLFTTNNESLLTRRGQ